MDILNSGRASNMRIRVGRNFSRETCEVFFGTLVYGFAAFVLLFAMADIASANDEICSQTAEMAYAACKHDTKDDFIIAKANCLNIKDSETREDCRDEAYEEKTENKALCKEQLQARVDVCEKIGEDRYDVTDFWIPENFVDPLQIGISVTANPYLPLIPHTDVFTDGEEIVTVTVTADTKIINGVTCLVVRDVVQVDGLDVEDTDDWFAQDINGNVWYCGEISKNFEFFAGDNPEVAELVDLEGSWKGFRDSAMPGITMKANPQVGDTYRQEMSLTEAEDVADIISIDANGILAGDFCEEDDAEIAAYVASVCNGDCLITRDYSPLEPDATEHKYYAPGLGFILETDPEGSCLIPVGAI